MSTELPADFAVHAERVDRAYVVAPVGELDLGTVDALRELMASRPDRCLHFFDERRAALGHR